MRLTALEPRWLSPDMLMFRSPTGHKDLITCKRKRLSFREQHALIWEANPDLVSVSVVMTKPDAIWQITGTSFETLTCMPSIDHSPSKNWHGFLVNGECR